MMDWLSQYSTAVQVLSALAIAVLTMVLIGVTMRYVRGTEAMVRTMKRDSAARLQPRIVPELNSEWEGQVAKGAFVLRNPGPNDAVLREVELDYYCSRSENTYSKPQLYQMLTHRLVPAGQRVECRFEICPIQDCLYHESHEGDCRWILRVRATCTDIMGLLEHVYSLDEVVGFSHYVVPPRLGTTWFKARTRALQNRLRNYTYRFRAWIRGPKRAK